MSVIASRLDVRLSELRRASNSGCLRRRSQDVLELSLCRRAAMSPHAAATTAAAAAADAADARWLFLRYRRGQTLTAGC